MLKITETITRSETVTREVTSPTEWGMFTGEGNRRITGYARSALRRLTILQDETGPAARRRRENAIKTFYKKWQRLAFSDKHGEAGDTAVREVVRGFGEDLVKATIDSWDSYSTEERLYEEAISEVYAERKKQ